MRLQYFTCRSHTYTPGTGGQRHGCGDVAEAGGGHDGDLHRSGDGVGGSQRWGGPLNRSLNAAPIEIATKKRKLRARAGGGGGGLTFGGPKML